MMPPRSPMSIAVLAAFILAQLPAEQRVIERRCLLVVRDFERNVIEPHRLPARRFERRRRRRLAIRGVPTAIVLLPLVIHTLKPSGSFTRKLWKSPWRRPPPSTRLRPSSRPTCRCPTPCRRTRRCEARAARRRPDTPRPCEHRDRQPAPIEATRQARAPRPPAVAPARRSRRAGSLSARSPISSSDDGKQAMLDIGDWGGLALRGGTAHRRPPPLPRRAAGAGAAVAAGRPGRWAARAAHRGVRRLLLGHRAVGREESRGRAEEARPQAGGRQPRQDFQSFHVKDPDGFDLQISNGNRRTAARDPRTARPGAGAVRATGGKPCGSITSRSRSRTTRRPSRSTRPARLEAREGRGQPERVRDRRHRRHHHPRRQRRRGGGGHAAGAPRVDRPHLVRHPPFDPDQVKAELESAVLCARGHRRQGRHPHGAVQELPHDYAERIRLQISATTRANRND